MHFSPRGLSLHRCALPTQSLHSESQFACGLLILKTQSNSLNVDGVTDLHGDDFHVEGLLGEYLFHGSFLEFPHF